MSFSLDSCVPAPVCQDKTYKMDTLSNYKDISEYLGDPKTADWVGQGEPVLYNGTVLLTMPPHSVGTVLATTEYMWYGSVTAKLKTSRDAGVVTAFILFSDVKDEIDYEFVGTELNIAQTNYYFQGIPNCEPHFALCTLLCHEVYKANLEHYLDDNSANITMTSDTYANWHEYQIQWTPDTITWLVDGQVGRVKKRSETWNATANQWAYPQTPSRVQISLWPGGADTNAKGTVDWAGGPIDWNSPEIKNYGYYFATFGEITVKCFNANSAPGTNKGVSYYYNDVSATNNTVVDGDKPTVLKSFLGTGLNMDAGASSASGTGSASATPNSIPGGGGAPAQVPGGGSSSNGGSSNGGSSSAGTAAACQATGFAQSCGGSTTKSDGFRGVERTLGASAFAVVVGFAGLLLL
jgi:Glycosyl hydrolases family 16